MSLEFFITLWYNLKVRYLLLISEMHMRIKKNAVTGLPASAQLAEVKEMQREYRNSNFGDKSSELSEIALALKALYGVNVQILQRMQENTSLAASQFLYINESNAAQNTEYFSTNITLNGLTRSIVLMGSGNVTLNHYSNYSPSNHVTIGVFPLNGSGIVLPYSFNIQPKSYFSVSTDSSSNGYVSLSVLLHPVSLTGQDLFLINNTPGS